MNLENYIESQHRELQALEILNPEFLVLYKHVDNLKLREVLASLHQSYLALFRTMNDRLPTGDFEAHFWAGPSRQLLGVIEMTMGLFRALKNSKHEIEIDKYYFELLTVCQSFLKKTGGSTIPKNMSKVELYYTVPIFNSVSSHKIRRSTSDYHYPLQLIGEGSYAQIYKYKDEYYDMHFALKRARKDLSDKELARFKREFETMKELSSPYVLSVYALSGDQKEYTMEYMDFSLEKYIQQNNTKIGLDVRRSIASQVLRAFGYLHSKNLQHRDISPKNILLREHDDVLIAKVSDFGLVKEPNSTLTSVNTEFKGYFNDPSLITEGFENYDLPHEIYALTKLLFYIMTGKTNTSGISEAKLNSFVLKGLSADKKMRYVSISEIANAFRSIF